MRRRTSPGSVGDVEAGDRARAAGGQQQGDEHAHGGRLAGAVGAEESVDLAGVDDEVDAVDGLHGAVELALQSANLDGAHARSLFVGARGDRARRYFGSGMPMVGSTPGPKTASSAVILTRCFPRV